MARRSGLVESPSPELLGRLVSRRGERERWGISCAVAVLLSARDLSHAFGARPLFEGVSFTISEGDRVGLIGPNGAGKSTLLKILAGLFPPDRGELARRGALRTAYLPQVPELSGTNVREAVLAGLPGADASRWEDESRVDQWLSRLNLDGEAPLTGLSGGWQKRVALARALVTDPELLLLDEPTNHLDVESILWLEKLLAGSRFATLTVTHDRLFLQRVATRIMELDRRNAGGLFEATGDYATYVEKKAEAMAAQERREEKLRNTLRRETEWLRRGAAARTTKQQARIQRAGELQSEVSNLENRNRVGIAGLDFQATDADQQRPKRLIEAKAVSKRYGTKQVLDGVDVFIGPRTRLGLIGPNGCGKSTLLRILTGQETADSGEVLRADVLSVAYFDQIRATLDPRRTAAETVCPDGDFVLFRGSHIHRNGYLERFLFRPEQMNQPVSSLSGGEQSRLLIARLMLTPANLLVLDEPTNDLDLATLDVLEEALESFDGAVLLVTHDRYFLDQVASELLAFHTRPGEAGRVTRMIGIEQWEAWHLTQTAERPKTLAPEKPGSVALTPPTKKKKFSFNEQRDWNTIEARILEAEGRLSKLKAESEQADVVASAGRLLALHRDMATAQQEVDALYARWAELEAMQKG